jgi:hypothetical protein
VKSIHQASLQINFKSEIAAESILPKKTEDYVDSVCVAIHGFNLIAIMLGVIRLLNLHCAANTYCGGRKTVIR